MKKIVRRMMGILAALALLVVAAAGIPTTASAATVATYTWEYTEDGGQTWEEVPEDMKDAIASIEYDGTDLTITSAGTVTIWGVSGEIVTIQEMDSSANLIGENLLDGDTAVIEDVEEPFYVYFDIEILGFIHSDVYTRISDVTYE